MVQVSFTLPVPYAANPKRAEGAALQLARKMGMEPALLVHAKAMGPDFTFFVVYGSVTHLVDLREVTVVEREYPLLTAKEANLAVKRALRRKLVVVGACIGTDAHTVGIDAILNIKGFAGEKGLEYYREIRVVNLGAQVLVPELVERARAGAGRRRARQPGRDAEGRPPAQHRADVGGLPRGVPRRSGAAARRRRPAVRRGLGGRARGGPGLRPWDDAWRGGVLPRPRPAHRDGEDGLMSDDRVGMVVVHRRYVPYSHAHYAGNLVDGAYSLAAFGDVATELCIRTDADEGLFASYSDVQFRAPVRAGDVVEIEARLVRVGRRSREMAFELRVVGRGAPQRGPSAADVLDPPLVATTARGTCVVP